MKLNTLEKIYNTLKYEQPELLMDADMIEKAKKPITRMLELSAQFGL
jgi:quinolinate synthase